VNPFYFAPTPDLKLPPEVTDVWLASMWVPSTVLRYGGATGWRRFPSVLAGRSR
jgi:hypothetical protein